MDIDLSAVAERLCAVRDQQGLSQTEFARQLGISPRALQSYEYAEREMSISVLDKLFEQFGVNPLWLLRGHSSAPQSPLTPDDASRLSAELYEQWQQAVESLPIDVSFELRRALYRTLSRATFRDLSVPAVEIAKTIEDLKP